MNILLFDMDGVLLEPHGYHSALQETVRLVALALGYNSATLTDEDITAFESAGVSSEWDSAAISTALLLVHAWDEMPDLELPESLNLHPEVSLSLRPPDFRAFVRRLGNPTLQELRPLERTEHLLLNEKVSRSTYQTNAIQSVLRHARAHQNSLTHRIFQELVLGSQVYAQTYQLPSELGCESYLLAHDLSNLNPKHRAALQAWLAEPDNRATIFTGRPSHTPSGAFSTPEAELGAQRVGLEHLPILGLGGLLWLAQQHEVGHQAFLKPSPVHVLAALQLALNVPLEDSLTRSAQLVLHAEFHTSWLDLSGTSVGVFEDTVAGLRSAQSAEAVLKSNGVKIDLSLFGIANHPYKSNSLLTAGANAYPSLGAALEDFYPPIR